ncbi:MAG: PAS domain S-box protein [Bryobacterales bacterium]|nr:PAS domain S-box protein [Bryobacterales bacterium]
MLLDTLLGADSRADRPAVLTALAFLIASIALLDLSELGRGFSLGFLYLLPMLVAALHLGRWEILGLAVLCTLLREVLGPFNPNSGLALRSGLGFLAFGGSGLFVRELAERRRRRLEQQRQLEEQATLRETAEQQLRALIETSPAAILTMDMEGNIRLANQAAHHMLELEQESLAGAPISRFLPLLAGVPPPDGAGRIFRTALECKGRRSNGEVFPAHVWLSSYTTVSGPMLAAIVLDASEELRDREAVGFDRLMQSSRVLIRAVSHEIRNICAAIAVVHANLRRVPGIEQYEDFKALGTLVEGLGQLVSSELRTAAQKTPTSVDLKELLEEFRIIVEPSFAEEETNVEWRIPADLPAVQADRHGVLHIWMNLAANSRRALRKVDSGLFSVTAAVERDRVVVRFMDTGPGVAQPELLFQPFRHSSDGTGLGLYLSRALARSFAGDLRYEPRSAGSCFAVELPAAAAEDPTEAE